MVNQFYPGIIGEFLLLSERNNGRAVYRSKGKISIPQQNGYIYGYIYLYSFDAEEYAYHENYESINYLTGTWVVRFIKYFLMIFVLVFNVWKVLLDHIHFFSFQMALTSLKTS